MANKRRVPPKLIVGIIGIAAIILIFGNSIGLPIPDFLGITDVLFETTSKITSTIYGENTGQAAILPDCIAANSCSKTVIFDIDPAPTELPPPITSNDTAGEQQADIFNPPILGIVAEIIKIDSDGKKDIDKVSIDFGPLSLVDTGGILVDYSTGFIEIDSLTLFGEANQDISGTGSFDVQIDNATIFTMPYSIEIATATFDGNGTAQILFVEPTGVKSPSYSFSFANHITKFPQFQLAELKFVISDFVITTVEPQIVCITIDPTPPACLPKQFGLITGDLLTLIMDNDPSKIIILDEASGENILANIADNNLVVSTLAKSITDDCIVSPPFGDVFIRFSGQPVQDQIKIFSSVGEGMKDLSTATPSCFATFPTAATTLIQRNTQYVIDFTDPVVSFEISTPQTQRDYHFSCQYVNASKLSKTCNFP